MRRHTAASCAPPTATASSSAPSGALLFTVAAAEDAEGAAADAAAGGAADVHAAAKLQQDEEALRQVEASTSACQDHRPLPGPLAAPGIRTEHCCLHRTCCGRLRAGAYKSMSRHCHCQSNSAELVMKMELSFI